MCSQFFHPTIRGHHQEHRCIGWRLLQGVGVWTVPVEIGPDGIPTTENPTTEPDVFRQAMNQYESGKIGLYSENSGEMTQVLLGGISANTFDPATEQLTYDENNGFHRQITAVLRDASGSYQQQYITDFQIFMMVTASFSTSARMRNSSLLMMCPY